MQEIDDEDDFEDDFDEEGHAQAQAVREIDDLVPERILEGGVEYDYAEENVDYSDDDELQDVESVKTVEDD